jgi:hypothetical protein
MAKTPAQRINNKLAERERRSAKKKAAEEAERKRLQKNARQQRLRDRRAMSASPAPPATPLRELSTPSSTARSVRTPSSSLRVAHLQSPAYQSARNNAFKVRSEGITVIDNIQANMYNMAKLVHESAEAAAEEQLADLRNVEM